MMEPQEDRVLFENVSRRFGKRHAVEDVSFALGGCGIIALLGPNGAGKTTIMRMLTGYLMPSEGTVWVAGCNTAIDPIAARRSIGYLPEGVPLYGEMRVRGYLEYSGRLRGLDRREARQRAVEVAELCAVTEYFGSFVSSLSRGYRQRVGLAQAIIHDPSVLVLDEPTSGIDPKQVVETRRLIVEFGRTRTVLLSTHNLAEVGAVCDRVLILHRGRLVADDSVAEISQRMSDARRIRLRIAAPPAEVTQALAAHGRVHHDGRHHVLDLGEGADAQTRVLRLIADRGWRLDALTTEAGSLEEAFVELTPDRAAADA